MDQCTKIIIAANCVSAQKFKYRIQASFKNKNQNKNENREQINPEDITHSDFVSSEVAQIYANCVKDSKDYKELQLEEIIALSTARFA